MSNKKVFIYKNSYREVPKDVEELVKNILQSNGFEVTYSGEIAQCQMVLVFGGDGSTLSAAHEACGSGVPILCINTGTLGFMSSLELSELELLAQLKDGFSVEKRMMLDVWIVRDGEEIYCGPALNEALVARNGIAGILTLCLFCDQNKAAEYKADGLIAATPTGSSAYSLSAGGPIIDTKLDAVSVCPVCSHSLAGARALVFSPDSVIDIKAHSNSGKEMALSIDGRKHFELIKGDMVRIRKSKKTTDFVKLKKDMFYDILNRKLR